MVLVCALPLSGCSGSKTPSAAPSSVFVAAQAKADAVNACRDLFAVKAADASTLVTNHAAIGDDAYAAAVEIAADAAKLAADSDPTWVTFYASVKQWADSLSGPASTGATLQQDNARLLPTHTLIDSTCTSLGFSGV